MDLILRKVLIKLVDIPLRNNIQLHNIQVRFYPRWSHRVPRRVLSAEQYEQMESNNIHEKELKGNWNTESKKTHSEEVVKKASDKLNSNIQPKRKKKVEVINQKRKTTDMLETVIDSKGNFIYTKLKDKDPQVSKIMTAVKSRKEKTKQELMLVEGKRIIKEALQAKCLLKYLLFSRKSDVEDLKSYLPKIGAKIFKIPYREIQMWSSLQTSPGIIGIFKIPKMEEYHPPPESLPLTIICDNMREPGNLGATLRVAAGVGAKKVILTKGCVDVWETKVIRSAAGAHFKVQICTKMDWLAIREQMEESTNVFVADSNTFSESNNSKYSEILPVLPYYDVNYSQFKNLVLIIGGETEGISEESYSLAAENKGARLNIPLRNNVESLNSGTALGIIAFEIRKQFVKQEGSELHEIAI